MGATIRRPIGSSLSAVPGSRAVPGIRPSHRIISAGKTEVFVGSALSGVATDLPSEKSPKSHGTVLNPELDCFARHSGTEMGHRPPAHDALSPEIYSLRA